MVSKIIIIGEQDPPQVTCVGRRMHCSVEETTSTRSSCKAHNDPFTRVEEYAGLLLGRQTTRIDTTIVQSSSENGGGSVEDTSAILSILGVLPPSPSPSPSPPPLSLPTSTSSSPPPPPSSSSSSSSSPLASHSHSNLTSPSPSSSPASSPSPSPLPLPSSSHSPTPSPSPFLSPPPPASAQRKLSNLGPIVGGVVGGILILMSLVLLLLFYNRRRRLSKGMINPFPAHINQGAINSMVMLVGPPPTNKCATGSGRSRFSTPSPSFFPVGPLRHADSGVRNVDPLYVLPIGRVELPPAYTQV